MIDEFSSIDRPWSKEVTEKRYTSGSRISLKTLAEVSGNSFDAIKQWSKDNEWVSKRRQFQEEFASQIEKNIYSMLRKTLEKDYAAILFSHFESAKTGRNLFDKRFRAELSQLERIENEVEAGEASEADLLAYLRGMNTKDLVLLSGAIERLIHTERESLGLPAIPNLDQAVSMLESRGFVVVDGDAWNEAIEAIEAEKPVLEECE